jgi:diadenosine tetraphosphate (Ap4A) HIT family hydrolase
MMKVNAIVSKDGLIPFERRVICESPYAFSVPTLGQIVEGYCLIFSKRGVLNLTCLEMEERRGVLDMLAVLGNAVHACYSSPIVFEHGSAVRRDEVGCGIDHAHLHVVPGFRAVDVARLLNRRCSFVKQHASLRKWLTDASEVRSPYVLLGSLDGPVAEYAYEEKRESQCVRRILAYLAGRPNDWDWRTARHEPALWRTLYRVRRFLGT